MGDESYPRRRHLKQRADFLAAYRDGRRAEGRFAAIYGLIRTAGTAERLDPATDWRLGITVTRRQANAVRRNRLRRRIREWARRHDPPLPAGWDIVVVARREAIDAQFAPLCEDLNRTLGRLLAKAKPKDGKTDAASTNEA